MGGGGSECDPLAGGLRGLQVPPSAQAGGAVGGHHARQRRATDRDLISFDIDNGHRLRHISLLEFKLIFFLGIGICSALLYAVITCIKI